MTARFALCCSLVAFAAGTQSAQAELPPQYTVWQNFAAVTALSNVPELVGIVERIERTEAGAYLVHGRSCAVEAKIIREPARGSDGTPMPGPSRIVRVELGEKRCK